jgi:hypothetical protein
MARGFNENIISAATLALAATSLCACATVTRGSNTAWQVNTVPSGAKVKTSNGFYCDSTPCAVRMPRRSTFTATITHDGYKPVEVQVTNRVSGGGGVGMAGNVLVGGLIGAGVDVASGAMLDLTPNPVAITMEEADAAAAVANSTDPSPVQGRIAPPAQTTTASLALSAPASQN